MLKILSLYMLTKSFMCSSQVSCMNGGRFARFVLLFDYIRAVLFFVKKDRAPTGFWRVTIILVSLI